MGQRVAFATNQNDLTAPFGYSGFSGFPFRVLTLGQSNGVGPGTNNPFGLTLDQAIEFWWRVKKINVSTVNYPSDPEEGFAGFSISGEIPSNKNTEVELTRGFPDDKQYNKDFGPFAPFPGDPGNETTLDCGVLTQEFEMVFSNDLYYPEFIFYVASDIDIDAWVSSKFYEDYYEVGTLEFQGLTTPIYGILNNALAPYEVEITYSEYYAYAATDGSPIYNTTTGARLQDPRN